MRIDIGIRIQNGIKYKIVLFWDSANVSTATVVVIVNVSKVLCNSIF